MAESFHLLVAIPDKEPSSYPLTGDSVSLGRSPDNDIQVLVREVSTGHCQFKKTDSGYEISDVGSTNGTKVNGHSVKNGVVALNDRDTVLLGETIPAYFVKAEEGAEIDVKGIVGEMKAAKEAADAAVAVGQPTVKKLAAPAPAKKLGVPGGKPIPSVPLGGPTIAAAGDEGSATLKLAKTPTVAPGAAPLSPAVKKLAPPGALPVATPVEPADDAIPTAVPLSAPPAATPPATKLPTLSPPTGAPAVKKIALPGAPPPPAAAPASPSAAPAGPPPPVKKLTMPAKKGAPKLNLPPKKDD